MKDDFSSPLPLIYPTGRRFGERKVPIRWCPRHPKLQVKRGTLRCARCRKLARP